MNNEQTAPASDIRLSDLNPFVVARIVIEWARIDPRHVPMPYWGNEYLGTHVTIGLDRWYIGRADKQAEAVIHITEEVGALGSGEGKGHFQRTWTVPVTELREQGCNARLTGHAHIPL